MGKKSLLLVVERAQIVALHIKRLSKRHIAKRLQCSKSSVHRAIEKFKKHKKTGRKLYEEMIMSSDKLSYNPPLFVVVKYMPIC